MTYLKSEVGDEERFGEADERKEDLDDPKSGGSADPPDGLPVDDRVIHKLLRRLLVGRQVFALVAHLATVAGTDFQVS